MRSLIARWAIPGLSYSMKQMPSDVEPSSDIGMYGEPSRMSPTCPNTLRTMPRSFSVFSGGTTGSPSTTAIQEASERYGGTSHSSRKSRGGARVRAGRQ